MILELGSIIAGIAGLSDTLLLRREHLSDHTLALVVFMLGSVGVLVVGLHGLLGGPFQFSAGIALLVTMAVARWRIGYEWSPTLVRAYKLLDRT